MILEGYNDEGSSSAVEERLIGEVASQPTQHSSSETEEEEGSVSTMSPKRHLHGRLPHRSFVNLQILSWSFFLVFLAFSTVQNLESSLVKGALGTASLGLLYLSLTFSSFVAPLFIDKLGPKLAINGGLSTYVLFVAANLDVQWWTLLPAAMLLGLGSACVWNAQGLFISSLGRTEAQVTRASGIFFSIYQFNQFVGNLLAFLIFKAAGDSAGTGKISEATADRLFGILTLIAGLGLATSCCLDRVEPVKSVREEQHHILDDDEEEEAQDGTANEFVDESEAWRMTTILRKDRFLRLVLPLFVYSGVQQSWVWGEFTAYLVKPTVGEQCVPLVMAVFGFCDAGASFALSKLRGAGMRFNSLLLMGSTPHLVVVLYAGTILHPEKLGSGALAWLFLIFTACILGWADATLNTLVTALLASRDRRTSSKKGFDNKVKLSFAHFKLWQSFATGIAFLYSHHLSLQLKSEIVLGSGIVGVGLVVFFA